MMLFYAMAIADQMSYDSDIDIIAFPFHETCLKVLCRSLFGHENVMMIDKDILHSVFSQLKGEMYPCQLLVDYGGIEGMEQIWDCISGEEVRFIAHQSLSHTGY
jgi:hypothetical protein